MCSDLDLELDNLPVERKPMQLKRLVDFGYVVPNQRVPGENDEVDGHSYS